jgi:hypothetical protein
VIACSRTLSGIADQNAFLTHAGAAMRVVEVLVARADFAKTLGAMREWLDRNDRRLSHFETEADGDIVTIKVQLDSDASAELFRQAFRGYAALIAGPVSDKAA